MNTQHWAWHAGRVTTNAVYATKDAVTSVAGSVKQGSVQTLAILKAGVAAAREERAKQRVGALDPRNKVEVK